MPREEFPERVYLKWEPAPAADPLLLVETDPGELPIGVVCASYTLTGFVRVRVAVEEVAMTRKKKR